jgi:hypothetical protein
MTTSSHYRQEDSEGRSLALFAFYLNPAPVCLNDHLAMEQPDAYPALLGGLKGAEKAFLDKVRCHATPIITDR